jgi:DNA-binding response OmpR family regulator
MAPRETAIPRNVLIVDDDERVHEAVRGILRAEGFLVTAAADGMEALTLLGREWFPVVVTERNMPVLDGIEFVQRLRATAVAPAYVIMTTESTDAQDYERGYCAGVDHYLPKQGFESQLLAKVSAAFTAIRRRQQTGTTGGRGPVTVDLENGAHTARHLIGRLNAEMAHAARSAHSLTVLSVCLESADAAVSSKVWAALLQAVNDAARPRLDWIARLPAPRNACRLAVIMPQAGQAEASALQQAVRNVFVLAHGNARLSFGCAWLRAGDAQTAVEMLSEAERRRRGADPQAHADLRAVQGEVAAPGSDAASAA